MASNAKDRPRLEDLAFEDDAPVTLVGIEQEPEPAVPLEPGQLRLAPPRPIGEGVETLALAQVLPPEFNLRALLTFLPDVRLKRDLDANAAIALAIDLRAGDGLVRADAARATLREQIAAIESRFDGTRDDPGPCALAYALHKRLTGLRSDFTKAGSEALTQMDRRVIAETRRREDEVREVQRRLQAEEDRKARERADQLAREAEAKRAPTAVVEALKARAETATAPPVNVARQAPLANSSVGEKWRARPRGTPDEAESNPAMADLTDGQWERIRETLIAVTQGLAPRAIFDINWSYCNARARGDRRALDIPGLEAYDEGSVRAKGRR